MIRLLEAFDVRYWMYASLRKNIGLRGTTLDDRVDTIVWIREWKSTLDSMENRIGIARLGFNGIYTFDP